MAELKRITADYDWAAILTLLRTSFAYMEGRIDPPSSLNKMGAADIKAFAARHILLVIEDAGAPVACGFATPRPDSLYLGKLAVAEAHRGRGYLRQIVDAAEGYAAVQDLPWLELQSRIELTDNHAAFARLGFEKTSEGRHPGYDRVTEITMRRPVSR
jgi:GNAT superfamily N-acetyltransferase